MDRDYTTEAEEEFSGNINYFTYLNNQYTFSTNQSTSNTLDLTYYSQMHSNILTANTDLYSSYMNAGVSMFDKVRAYDAQKAYDETVQDELHDFKIKLQTIRELIKIPQLGSTVQNINYNLGRYGRESALYGSIFGDSIQYAENVEAVGFAEQAQNSRAYYERTLKSIFYIDESGNRLYNMAVIKEILAKDADEITVAEYTAIATAYTYMNESDMEALFIEMMTLTNEENYSWLEEKISLGFNIINEDYYEWTIDEEKWSGFTQGLNLVSQYNLVAINNLQDMNRPDAVEACAKLRKNIVQKQAVADAMHNVNKFRASYGADRPYINIAKKDTGEYEICFKEYYAYHALNSLICSSTLHDSKIEIGQCLCGYKALLKNTERVCVSLHEYVSPYFNSGGFVNEDAQDMFIIEHILGLSMNCELEYIEFEAGGDNVPFLGTFLESTLGAVVDYEKGKADAAFVEITSNTLRANNVFLVFDCYVVRATYDTYNIVGDSIFAEAGEDTVRRVKYFNENIAKTGDKVSINQIIEDPISVHEMLILYSDEEEIEKIEKSRYYEQGRIWDDEN